MKLSRTTLLIIFAVIIILIAGIVFFVVRKHDDVSKDDQISQPINQVKSLVTVSPEIVPVNHDSYLSSVSGSYPQFNQADSSFNKKIADTVNKDITDFTSSASADYQTHMATGGDAFQKEFASGGYYFFNVNTTINQSNEKYISIVIREEGYTGGAHPFHTVATYNYDVKKHHEISLSDLFPMDSNYLKTVSSYARTDLTKQLTAASGEKKLDANMKSMLDDGTDSTKAENFQIFTFTDSAITLYFGEYQVAPYVFGEQSVIMPLSK
jgi:hypothetical protein